MSYAKDVTESTFREVLRELLFPLFPGTDFNGDVNTHLPLKNRKNLVTQNGQPTNLRVMPHEDSAVCLSIHRPQPFSPEEKEIIHSFLKRMERCYRDWDKPYREDTAASVMSEVVAHNVSADAAIAATVERVASTLLSWAEQTYEGRRISFTVGTENSAGADGATFQDLAKEDFVKVLGNAPDTMLVFGNGGCFVRHEALSEPNDVAAMMCPYRFQRVAAWSKCDTAARVAVLLNRNGELLVFRDGQLLFARRRGDWRYFAHEATISQFTNNALAKKSDADFRRALYCTAIDAAFTRTGACIGVFTANEVETAVNDLIDPNDRLSVTATDLQKRKATITRIIGKRKFQDLDRRLRSELAAMDGALVLDHKGNFLAAGAILKISGGSASGGREQASKELAKHGLGLKVSSDGYIRVRGRDDSVIAEIG